MQQALEAIIIIILKALKALPVVVLVRAGGCFGVGGGYGRALWGTQRGRRCKVACRRRAPWRCGTGGAGHASAIAHYVALAGLPSHVPAELVGIDSEGFHLRIGQGLYWLAFAASCNTPAEVRQAFVRLAHAETWPTDGAALA